MSPFNVRINHAQKVHYLFYDNQYLYGFIQFLKFDVLLGRFLSNYVKWGIIFVLFFKKMIDCFIPIKFAIGSL